MTTRTNQEWVSALRGDFGEYEQQYAFEELGEYIFRVAYKVLYQYSQSKPALRHYTQQQLHEEARNFTQTALEKIFARKLYDRYREQKNVKFKSYIAKIAVTVIISALRGKKNNWEFRPFGIGIGGLDDDTENPQLLSYERMGNAELTPEIALGQQEIWMVVLKCIEVLPTQQKEVFRLNVLQGIPAQEVADKLHLTSVQALYNLVNRARKKMRICVEVAGWRIDEIKQIFG